MAETQYRFNPQDKFPPLSSTQLEAYLTRIGIPTPPPPPTLAFLNHLLDCHSRTIPFENAEILLCNIPVRLDPSSLIHRLVTRSRGGYCFQINALLNGALAALGFTVSSGVARSSVWDPVSQTRVLGGPTHMVVFVHGLDEDDVPYIADMGYNQIGLTQAIQVKVGATVPCAAGEAHCVKAAHATGQGNFMVCHQRADWAPLTEGCNQEDRYTDLMYVTMEKYRPQDFEVLNFYVSNCNDHIVRRSLLVSIVTKTGGRAVIVDKKFRRREGAEHRDLERNVDIESVNMLVEIMRDEFGIEMSEEEAKAAQLRYFL